MYPKDQSCRYKAFISYRHLDNKVERRQWATWLHQMLETYEVPADLVGTTNGRGEEIPERIYPVFRDEEELPAEADLASPIYQALDESENLIVICSPRSVSSKYVANEISYFKRLGRADQVLAMMIDGEPNTSIDAGKQTAGLGPEHECFPKPLQYEIDSAGVLTDLRTEPVAADFRVYPEDDLPMEGWTSPAAYRASLQEIGRLTGKEINAKVDEYKRQLELMKLKLIVGVLGVALGELTKRDEAYQLKKARKRQRILVGVIAAVSLLAVTAIGGGIAAWSVW